MDYWIAQETMRTGSSIFLFSQLSELTSNNNKTKSFISLKQVEVAKKGKGRKKKKGDNKSKQEKGRRQ
jgi:hypothetical protein